MARTALARRTSACLAILTSGSEIISRLALPPTLSSEEYPAPSLSEKDSVTRRYDMGAPASAHGLRKCSKSLLF
jgi:hypothetical protein